MEKVVLMYLAEMWGWQKETVQTMQENNIRNVLGLDPRYVLLGENQQGQENKQNNQWNSFMERWNKEKQERRDCLAHSGYI